VATRTDFDLQVAGLKELIAGLRVLQGAELRRVVDRSLTSTMRRVVVPEMKRQMGADFKDKNSHRSSVKPGRGQGGPAERNVTVRTVRKRAGELTAKSAGPRAWWSHFPIAGTKAHSLAARSGRKPFSVLPYRPDAAAGRRARQSMGFTLTKATPDGGTRTVGLGAIRIVGSRGEAQTRGNIRSNAGLRSPGTRGTNSIQKAVQRVVTRVNQRYASDLGAAYQKHLVQPTRRAKPR
jgi:hypothetical protein